MINILDRINELKNQRNWTEWKLSEVSGVDQSTISAWYKKGRTPSVESLEKICIAFEITMSQFFLEEDNIMTLTSDQKEIVELLTALNGKQRQNIILFIKNMSSQN